MKVKLFTVVLFVFFSCLFVSVKAFAMSESDIRIEIFSPVNNLDTENGVIAVEQFPSEIIINTEAISGNLTDIRMEYKGEVREISSEYTLQIERREECCAYTITACTDNGAVLTITANVVFQVNATYDIRYRTVGMKLTEVYDGAELIKSFPVPQYVRLENANTIRDSEEEQIAGMIGKSDGNTYLLKGSLVVEVYHHTSGELIGTFDTRDNFERLTTGFGWTPKCYLAFESMRYMALSYQAPIKISVEATWCDEKKQEVYGTLSAQDKGVPEYLYPYQSTSVTFAKDDISLSRNFIYAGLEWDYTPETDTYPDGESKTRTKVTQVINTKIPAVDFYFKFKKQDSSDLSVSISAPRSVCRGDSYSFTVTYTNSGSQSVFDVPMEGKIDSDLIKEIPAMQDFSSNENKANQIKRSADTTSDEIHLWAHIGIPEGIIDKNPDNNTATVVIQVVDPEPEPTPEPKGNPNNPGNPDNPDDSGNPPNNPPDLSESCDLSADIFAPSSVYEHEDYSYTVYYTNHSNKSLNAVSILAKNNEDTLKQIPKSINLKPQEIKSYTFTGTAGSAGDTYLLWANLEAPKGFEDENTINNTAVTKITVIEKTTDNPDDPDTPDDPGDPDNPDTPDNPNCPDNPDKPGAPDDPTRNLCDLWVNLSYPPEVYAEEEYSFTVYFTNDTDKSLSNVKLYGSMDSAAISVIPSTVNFKPHETKSYRIKERAGKEETVILLWAQVLPSSDYYDTNMGNNQTIADIIVKERPFDLDVQRITPDTYKENQTVISTILVSNKGALDFTPGQKVSILFEIPELSIKKAVDTVVMEKDTWNTVSVKWNTPNVPFDTNVTLIATINSNQTLGKESSATNNTYTQKAVIKNVSYEMPAESVVVPIPPQRNAISRVTWWEQRYENGRFIWKSFYAELKVSASLDYDKTSKGFIKSGYGFGINVIATVDTNYDRPELITEPQVAEVYLPQYSYETAIPLLGKGSFTFRENPNSPFGYKNQYVPVWFPDNRDYIVQLLVTDAHTPAGILSKWITGGTLQMKVEDSMYSDDATTGGRK